MSSSITKRSDGRRGVSFFPMEDSAISTYKELESPLLSDESEAQCPTPEEILAQIPHPPSSLWPSSTSSSAPPSVAAKTTGEGAPTPTGDVDDGCESTSVHQCQSPMPFINGGRDESDLRDCASSGLFQDKNAIKSFVLLVLCLQNSLFTVLRRYSHGVLQETASKYEVLLLGEIIKIVFSAWMIHGTFRGESFAECQKHLVYVASNGGKMVVLAIIYGMMNILSFVSLRNIGAGMFTIFAQCKILTTATFSTMLLGRKYSATKWRALIGLMFGVLLFSEPIWGEELKHFSDGTASIEGESTRTIRRVQHAIGIMAVLVEVTLSGFASIYFEKVVKADSSLNNMNIWERNFQLAIGSVPIYMIFIVAEQGGSAGYIGGGWSWITVIVSLLGAAGGLLVALSIKYGDAILKTLATTGAIILSSLLDHLCLGGSFTPVMMIAGVQVVLAIFDYTFDKTPQEEEETSSPVKARVSSAMPDRSQSSDVGMKRNTIVQRSKSAPRTLRRNQSAFNRIMAVFPSNEQSGLVLPSSRDS
mmetsp:Transcript_20501/g.56582  ORF Transcript_20501/g.56582 Transcript_20501/m.56582 type:complete len:532 (+) Transcript_20501:71-1666(+)